MLAPVAAEVCRGRPIGPKGPKEHPAEVQRRVGRLHGGNTLRGKAPRAANLPGSGWANGNVTELNFLDGKFNFKYINWILSEPTRALYVVRSKLIYLHSSSNLSKNDENIARFIRRPDELCK